MSTASTSHHLNMIQFPRLPSVSPSWEAYGDKSLPANPLPRRNGRTLKQSRSSESLSQRKDRVEFLRQREWTRRAAAGGDQPTVPTRRTRTYSWEDIVAAADAAASTFDYDSSGYTRRPDTIDETDEMDEPYVIYTASPRAPSQSPSHSHSYSPSSSSLSFTSPSAYTYTPHTPGATVIYSTSPSNSPSPSPTLSPLSAPSTARDVPSIGIGGPYYGRRASWRGGPHSRHSSLSSISEEDEGLVRF